jgi:hypothetical protein
MDATTLERPHGHRGRFARQTGSFADVVRRLDSADRAALYRGDPTLGQDGGAEEDREYQDPNVTVAST